MSGTLLRVVGGTAASVPLAILSQKLSEILSDATRMISGPTGSIVPNVVLEESHSDGLSITEHPVEFGASITDHSFKRPAEVTMKMGWTNSSIYALGSEGYVREVYAQLLAMQAVRKPLQVVTGKRTYASMLIEEISLRTDASTEYALMVDAVFKEIIIVSTSAASVAPSTAQAIPSATSPVLDQGTVSAAPISTPANQSGLSAIVGLFGG